MERTWAIRFRALVMVVATTTTSTKAAPPRHGGTVVMLPARQGSYQKQHTYVGVNFFDNFNFVDSLTPKDGHVTYVSRHYAQDTGLVEAELGNAFLRVDASTVTGGARRKSVRLSSKAVYNSGLFVLSLDHVPTGCGTWPSFRLEGNGVINIIEGVHSTTELKATLHTTEGCSQSSVRSRVNFSGVWESGSKKAEATDCSFNATGQWKGQGCEQKGPVGSMGKPFNDGGGGTFVTEWSPTSGRIQSWFFRHGTQLPPDLAAGNPDPESWGKPYSFFRLSEDSCPKRHFANMSIMLDIALCGSYGDALFKSMCPSESKKSDSCNEYISKYPQAMQQAYWSIHSLDVYQFKECGNIISCMNSVAENGIFDKHFQASNDTRVLGTMTDADVAPTNSAAATSHTKATKPTAVGSPEIDVAVPSQSERVLATSTSQPSLLAVPAAPAVPAVQAVPGALQDVGAAKAAAWKLWAAGRQSVKVADQQEAETASYVHDVAPEVEKAGSAISGLFHSFQPAGHSGKATSLALVSPAVKSTGAAQQTITGVGIVNAGGASEQSAAIGTPAIHLNARTANSASLYCCSAALALGIIAFWTKIGRLALACIRHDEHGVVSQHESTSYSTSSVGSSFSRSLIWNGSESSVVQVGKYSSSDRHVTRTAGCNSHSTENVSQGPSNSDAQPALLQDLEADDGQVEQWS